VRVTAAMRHFYGQNMMAPGIRSAGRTLPGKLPALQNRFVGWGFKRAIG
jgi:hypothetical protein